MSKKSGPYVPRPETIRRTILKQANRLFPADAAWQEAFADAIMSGSAGKPAMIWLATPPAERPFGVTRLADWQPEWIDAITEPGNAVGQHQLHKDGAYYLLDFSSIVSASVLLTVDASRIRTVLDLCSAPGGKGIFAWRATQPELLVCNEVIAKRGGALVSNLSRCHIEGSVVTRWDPAQIAEKVPQAFDLVIVDAPCSGQSLPAKGEAAPGAYQPNMVAMNMARQRRILANAVETVAPGGYLAYMTCTYSREENEKNVEWLLRRFPEFSTVEVEHLAAFRSPLLADACYRHHPQDGFGVGGFVALFKRAGERGGKEPHEVLQKLTPLWKYQ